MSYAGHGPADKILPQRIPGATFHRPAAITLRPIDPEQARHILASLAADRPDTAPEDRPLAGDDWGTPHAHGAF